LLASAAVLAALAALGVGHGFSAVLRGTHGKAKAQRRR
jgi:hypothetical protein